VKNKEKNASADFVFSVSFNALYDNQMTGIFAFCNTVVSFQKQNGRAHSIESANLRCGKHQ